MSEDDGKGAKPKGYQVPALGDAVTKLPRLRSESALTSFLVRVGLLDEVNLLEREEKAWHALRRVAEAQLAAARTLPKLRELPQILAEDARAREHERDMAEMERRIAALNKGAQLTEARTRVVEAATALKNAKHPPPPEKPPEPETAVSLARELRLALEELDQSPLSPEEKAAIKKRMQAAFQVKLGDMTL